MQMIQGLPKMSAGEMQTGNLIVGWSVAWLLVEALRKGFQSFLMSPKLNEQMAQIEEGEKIAFEPGGYMKLISGFCQQAVALIVKAERKMGFAQVGIPGNCLPIFLNRFRDTVYPLKSQGPLKVS